MKKFPPFLLFAFIFLSSLSCDHDEDSFINEAVKTSDQNSSHPVAFLKATDVPNVVDRISLTSKRSKSQLSGREGSFGYVLDMEHIVGVTDSVGNKTYAFRMYLENGNENAFYNLLVTERANGEEMPIAVLEYNMEPQYFEDRANGIAREGDYQRNILYYAFSDFSQIGGAGKNMPIRHKPNNPCGEVSGDINGTGGGDAPSAPGGGDGPQTGTSPGTSNSVGGARAGGYGSVAGSATTPRQGSRGVVEVGDGCFCQKHEPKQEGDSQKGSGLAGKDDDCPKGELVIPINEEDGIWHTACRSFEYSELGNTGTIVAGVEGISHPVARGGKCPGIGYVFPQSTYYFSLPAHRYSVSGSRTKRESTRALERAFGRLDKWFSKQPCKPNAQANAGQLARKLEEFVKSEFKKIGGAASKYPPLGWEGESQEYETNVGLERPDC